MVVDEMKRMTRLRRKLQHVKAAVDRFCLDCVYGEYGEWVLAAAITFLVCGTLAVGGGR